MIYYFYKVMIICLVCTIVIESLVALIIGVRDKKDFVNIVLVNVVTNPIVVVFPYIISLYNHNLRIVSLVLFEIMAFVVEALIYKKVLKYKKINYFSISLILNASSYFIGEIINRIIW